MTPQEEKSLIEEAKTDDTAFSRLYEYYMPRIYGYICKRVGKRETAEDITSQTFLKAVEHFNRFSGPSFKSWIYRIATNTMIDYFRTHKHIEPIEDHADLPIASVGPTEEASAVYDRDMILSCLKKLPQKYQQVLHLKFFADLSNGETALSLGITENYLGVLLHRSLKSFQKVYNKNLPYV